MARYGSLVNMVSDGVTKIEPEVGMGATLLMWSDRHAYTIIEVHKNGKRFLMQRDIATRADDKGMSESQLYSYEPDPDAPKVTVTLRKDGRWKTTPGGESVLVGHRREYYDFSF